jgi:RHS repeat-associated protein
MGEKFAANPVTGTGSMSVPISISPGRSGFGPQLSLSYDSGAGNGPFGFGWNLSLPSITRKTDKGLPKYEDANDSDVFILSGAEDLVPEYRQDADGSWVNNHAGYHRDRGELWVRDQKDQLVIHEENRDGYRVRCYRPRIEGLFARIERWTRRSGGDVYWRSISRDNITTFYGKTEESRIANPENPSQIFSWLICQSYDDKGNAIVYKYKEENSDGIDLAQIHEKNRTSSSRSANRLPKKILYGNLTPNRDAAWNATDPAQLPDSTWMFEVLFDYEDGHYQEQQPDANERIFAQARINPPAGSHWPACQSPFSIYRARFEVRTYRLCQRVLMFHHFPDELGTADYLVRSTEFTYNQSPIASFITQTTQSGYVRQPDSSYLKKSLPPLSFEYSQAVIQDEIETIDIESLQNLPVGADGLQCQWIDLDGEGLQCLLSEQDQGWYYKRNVSPISIIKGNGKEKVVARFEPLTEVATQPSIAEGAAKHQFLDLAGDGNLDLVQFEKPVSGFFERTEDEKWESFIPFRSAPNVRWQDPNLRFVDLTGDGHADILITEDDALTWYPSLAEEGFGPAERVHQSWDEEKGPRLIFADGTQSIFLADVSGDGLTDFVRIRNGEVCYWPNLGYGHFGAKVTMDNAPWFDAPDQFDQRRIRLADVDGSGTTDIIYLERHRVAVYRNECGNAWSPAEYVESFPAVDDLSSVTAVDLLSNGTACLVWSSPLPGNAQRQMRYVALMEEKPHLLVGVKNNLGAETVIQYAPSTKFYLADKRDENPWITRLPFPVHVVERVETHDLISRNRFVTRYAYHHGYFDGVEREFRGFGMVEQFDTEELGALTESGNFPNATNIDAASYVPTALTKTWFHTGAYIEGDRISRHFEDEYYHEGDESEGVLGLTNEQLEAMLLPDTELPETLKRQDGSSVPWELTAQEVREACRALKGAVLRREIYALDGTDDEDRPYSATEQNYTIELLQPQGEDMHAVFFTHPRESINFHYERKLVEVAGKKIADPRVTHAMTLEVDGYANVLKSVAIGYGRRPGLSPVQGDDKNKQERTHVTYTETAVTNSIDETDDYRTPLPSKACTYELLTIAPDDSLQEITYLFGFDEMVVKAGQASDGSHDLPYEDIHSAGATANHPYRRLIEQVRTFYRRNDLAGALSLGQVESFAIPYKSYKLAFTPGLLPQVFQRNGQPLLPNPANELGGQGADCGGYVDLDGSGHWWVPSGRVFLSPNKNDTAAQELTYASQHFFLPHLYRDPFHTNAVSTETLVTYDAYDLLMLETRDALGNTAQAMVDYRVLQPKQMTDSNGNRSEVAFDVLGLVAGTAVMGKATETLGDLLDASFEPNPTQAQLGDFMAKPREASANPDQSVATQIVYDLLGKAAMRIIYDLDRFQRVGEPPFAATIGRETHVSDLQPIEQTKIQISFSYSDGFGREIQKKIQAEPGPVPQRDGTGKIIVGPDGLPVMTPNKVSPRWVGSGWTMFNNKGKPVRQYEPFFTDRHFYEFDVRVGVSPVLFYDPVERVVATLHPNHTYEKVVFDPWQQITYDVNDTVTFDPKADDDVKEFFTRLRDTDYLPTWYEQRIGGLLGAEEEDAAEKAAIHADTSSIAHADSLGRTFLTIAHNKFERNGAMLEEEYATRVLLDIEGNQRAVIDAKERMVMRYDYDMLGNRIHQASMEAGERWMLNDVMGKPIRAWDSRDHQFRTTYDPLRRPIDSFLSEGNAPEVLVAHSLYGETQLNPELKNQRGKVVRLFDQAGVLISEDYDFKGNLLQSKRQLAREYKATLDWLVNPIMEQETFMSTTFYDALNRPIQSTAPHSDQPGTKINVIRPSYNEANLLEQVHAWLTQSTEPAGLLDPGTSNLHAVTNIDYNAKGQRELIEYGNGVSTSYEYDPDTFRLTNLKTTRPANLNGLATQLFKNPGTVQDLHYTYDPAGNITRIADEALPVIFNNNQQVDPVCSYIYDALYRLIEATGREHIGQTARVFDPPDGNRRDYPFAGLADFIAHPNDLQAIRRYTERYDYDAVGNFQFIHHVANVGNWTRGYECNEASLIEPSKQSNRLTKTTIGNGTTFPETYAYTDALGNDVHGCMTAINSMKMAWDFKDRLQYADLGGGGDAYYVYDIGGQRMRKVIEKNGGTLIEERLYLGGFEVFRRRNGGGAVTLERETLHIRDDKQRIALVETRTQGNESGVPQQLIRYQFGNHLGSASLELDDLAQLVSYEEYYPHGSTSYQSGANTAEVSLKRYRYTGMERDEETGFEYHSARYYAPWIGRWISCDPIWGNDGVDLYIYTPGSPTGFTDRDGTGFMDFVGGFFDTVTFGGTRWLRHKTESWIGVDDLPDNEKVIDESTTSYKAGSYTGLAASFVIPGTAFARSVRAVGWIATAERTSVVLGVSILGNKAADKIDPSGGLSAAFNWAMVLLPEVAPKFGGPSPEAARMDRILQEGGPTGGGRSISGAEVDVPGYTGRTPIRARSGQSTPAPDQQVVPHSPVPEQRTLTTYVVENALGEHAYTRATDAEIKNLEEIETGLPPDPTGTISLGSTKPLCPSCTSALFEFAGRYPGIDLRVYAPVRPAPRLPGLPGLEITSPWGSLSVGAGALNSLPASQQIGGPIDSGAGASFRTGPNSFLYVPDGDLTPSPTIIGVKKRL